jgi:hypothetical protein
MEDMDVEAIDLVNNFNDNNSNPLNNNNNIKLSDQKSNPNSNQNPNQNSNSNLNQTNISLGGASANQPQSMIVLTDELSTFLSKNKVEIRFCHECGEFNTKNHTHGMNLSPTCLFGCNLNFYHPPERCGKAKATVVAFNDIVKSSTEPEKDFDKIIEIILGTEANNSKFRNIIYWLYFLKDKYPETIKSKPSIHGHMVKRMQELKLLYIAQPDSTIEAVRRIKEQLKLDFDVNDTASNLEDKETYAVSELLQHFPNSAKRKSLLEANNSMISNSLLLNK